MTKQKIFVHIDPPTNVSEFTLDTDSMKALKGLPSGRLAGLEIQGTRIVIKPYYRKLLDGNMHIYAVPVTPSGEQDSES